MPERGDRPWGQPTTPARTEPDGAGRMWHITLTLAGPPGDPEDVRRALERLAHEHPFLLAGRYAADHAEVRYWEEAPNLHDAAAIALRLWGEHRRSADLPPWELIGLEVVDRPTYQKRAAAPAPLPIRPGRVQPF
ncbi:hypothetical protein ACFRCG_05830 [Embleya sp. NPDC056575]|uniref:hypothetical protein n=1 Tax=unclassified Embleya TaxID=2699296 RepID=UPI00368AE39A